MDKKNKSIFISHIIEDRSFAEALAKGLEAKGYEVYHWAAPSTRGQKFVNVIEDALMKSDIFVILLSPKSLSSQWVNFELGFALRKSTVDENTRILPILVENLGETDTGFLGAYDFLDSRNVDINNLVDQLNEILIDTDEKSNG